MENASFEGMRYRVRRIPAWQVWLIAGVVLALLATLAIVALGVFLVVLPVVLVGGLVWRLLAGKPADEGPVVIEGEYRVLEPAERGEREPPRP